MFILIIQVIFLLLLHDFDFNLSVKLLFRDLIPEQLNTK